MIVSCIRTQLDCYPCTMCQNRLGENMPFESKIKHPTNTRETWRSKLNIISYIQNDTIWDERGTCLSS